MAEQLISMAEQPDNYVRPETQRPRLHDVVPDAEIPVVDLADPDRAAVVASVAEACRTHGSFQVLNHWVPEELTAAHDFFRLPAEEKAKLHSDDPDNPDPPSFSMDLSSMIRPVLNPITTSVASTTSYGRRFITRVLSFTGFFNDRTSLLHEHDAELERPTQTEEAAAPTSLEAPEAANHPFDIEAGTTPLAATGTAPDGPVRQEESEPASDHDAESCRVGKSVQTGCLSAASASLVLFANLPASSKLGAAAASGQHALYSADMAFVSLGFFSSLGLSMFSVVARPGGEAAVARVQSCRSG